jgi:hypothetical protein
MRVFGENQKPPLKKFAAYKKRGAGKENEK